MPGSAAGTWLSNLIGIAAIAIAVFAFVNDRRRAKADALRERCRPSEDVLDFLIQAETGLNSAYLDVQQVMSHLRDQCDESGPNAPPRIDISDAILRWNASAQLVADLRRAAAVMDASSALILSEAYRALDTLTHKVDLRVYMVGGLLSQLQPAEKRIRSLLSAFEQRRDLAQASVIKLRG